MKMHIFPMEYPLDLRGTTHILQGGTLRHWMTIHIFPMGYLLDLNENANILQGVPLEIAWKFVYIFQWGVL